MTWREREIERESPAVDSALLICYYQNYKVASTDVGLQIFYSFRCRYLSNIFCIRSTNNQSSIHLGWPSYSVVH